MQASYWDSTSPRKKIVRMTAIFAIIIWKIGDRMGSKVDPSLICEAQGVYTTEEIILYVKMINF